MKSVYNIFYYGAFEGYLWAESSEAAISEWLSGFGFDPASAGYVAVQS